MAFKEETTKLMDVYLGRSIKSSPIIRNIEEIAPMAKKESLFHNFMIGLQILNVLHTMWLMLDDFITVSYK